MASPPAPGVVLICCITEPTLIYASSACGAILIYCVMVSPARCYIETVHGISELCWYTAWYYIDLLPGKLLLLLWGVMLIWQPLPVMVQYWSIAWQCCLLIHAGSWLSQCGWCYMDLLRGKACYDDLLPCFIGYHLWPDKYELVQMPEIRYCMYIMCSPCWAPTSM